jgi:hypothetical protein
MDCRTALKVLDCERDGVAGLGEADVKAAQAHLAECPRCLAIAEGRRQLDRNIGRVMRAVHVPLDAQERLITKLTVLESGAKTAVGLAVAAATTTAATTVSVAETSDVVTAASLRPRPAVRRWTRRLVPVAACLVVAAIGFFSVIWLMTPRWTVADVSQQLARIDFTTLDTLREFGGDPRASQLPDPAWQKLDWTCHKIAKGWPEAGRHQFAVYGFILPGRQRHPVRGLLAVIPRGQMRSPPEEQSVLTAQQFGDYLSAQIGESVSVAWTENDLVYVCVIEGGGESLSTLTQILGPSAA